MKVKIVKRFWCSCGNAHHPHHGIILKHIHSKGEFLGYEAISIEYCCAEMQKAVDGSFITFGKFEDCVTENKDINIMHCTVYFEEGDVAYEEMAIRFCPFCGEGIIIEEVSDEE